MLLLASGIFTFDLFHARPFPQILVRKCQMAEDGLDGTCWRILWMRGKQTKHTHTHKKKPLSIYIITESHFYLRNLPPPIMEISRYSYMSSLDVCLRIIRNFNLAPIRTGLRSPTDPRFRNDHASLVFHVAHFTSRPSEKNSWYSMQQLSMTHIFMFSLLWWPLVVVAVITGAKEEVTWCSITSNQVLRQRRLGLSPRTPHLTEARKIALDDSLKPLKSPSNPLKMTLLQHLGQTLF